MNIATFYQTSAIIGQQRNLTYSDGLRAEDWQQMLADVLTAVNIDRQVRLPRAITMAMKSLKG